MKLLPGLAVIFLLAAGPAFAQGVRMSADFLPLAVGNRWFYDVTNEQGQALGQMDFAVQEHSIIAGRSFYVLTEFPFAATLGEPVRLLRYDRLERQFIRMVEDEEGPLFLSDGASTEVLQADAAGLPQKFILQTDTAAFTFQRGVGIVEARYLTENGVHVAKIARVRIGEGLPGAGTAAADAPATAGVTEAAAARPPTERARDLVDNLTTITEENPRIELTATPVAQGQRFRLSVTNISEKLLPFQFTSSQTYDFVVTDLATGSEVWRWSKENFFTQVMRSEALRAKGNWTYEVTWNHRDNDLNPVPAGKYQLVGIVSSQMPVESLPITIDVP